MKFYVIAALFGAISAEQIFEKNVSLRHLAEKLAKEDPTLVQEEDTTLVFAGRAQKIIDFNFVGCCQSEEKSCDKSYTLNQKLSANQYDNYKAFYGSLTLNAKGYVHKDEVVAKMTGAGFIIPKALLHLEQQLVGDHGWLDFSQTYTCLSYFRNRDQLEREADIRELSVGFKNARATDWLLDLERAAQVVSELCQIRGWNHVTFENVYTNLRGAARDGNVGLQQAFDEFQVQKDLATQAAAGDRADKEVEKDGAAQRLSKERQRFKDDEQMAQLKAVEAAASKGDGKAQQKLEKLLEEGAMRKALRGGR